MHKQPSDQEQDDELFDNLDTLRLVIPQNGLEAPPTIQIQVDPGKLSQALAACPKLDDEVVGCRLA